MMSNLQCLYIYILLHGGVILIIFIRAFFRSRLLKDYAEAEKENLIEQPSNVFLRLLFVIPLQIQNLRKLRRSITTFPISIQRRYK